MLPREAFKVMRRPAGDLSSNPRDLRASYARRLDSGEVIVANSYLGRTRANQPYTGEVFVVSGEIDDSEPNAFGFSRENLGFSHLSVRLRVADLGDSKSLYVPVFADLR
jgi:hypothetical protein